MELEADGGGESDAELQKMQAEAAKQLVEARLRKYKALKHRVGVCMLCMLCMCARVFRSRLL